MTKFICGVRLNAVFLSFLFLFLANGCFAQLLETAETPDWALFPKKNIESSVQKYDVQSGYYYTFLGMAYNDIIKSEYVLAKFKILNKSGIDGMSQVNIPFDSTYQSVQFHGYKK